MSKCKYCSYEGPAPLEHLTECQFAPEEARESAKNAWSQREAYIKLIVCCKLRKKILLKPIKLPEEYCGVSDAECVDVMTFEKVQGIDVVQPRFCPWCGLRWVPTGKVFVI